MRRPALPAPIRAVLLSEMAWRLLPTPATMYSNRELVREPRVVPPLPAAEWSRRERRELLIASEARQRNLEAKGPGLATVSAIVSATVLVSITAGWQESMVLARILLALAGLYAVLSLLMPLYLVGPLKRDTIDTAELEAAAAAPDPEESLAESAANSAMRNDLRNTRLANQLDAARRELSYTLGLFLLWVALVPATGALRHDGDGSPHVNRTHHSRPSG